MIALADLERHARIHHILAGAKAAAHAEHGVFVRTVERAHRHGVFTAVVADARREVPLVVRVEIERMERRQSRGVCAHLIDAPVERIHPAVQAADGGSIVVDLLLHVPELAAVHGIFRAFCDMSVFYIAQMHRIGACAAEGDAAFIDAAVRILVILDRIVRQFGCRLIDRLLELRFRSGLRRAGIVVIRIPFRISQAGDGIGRVSILIFSIDLDITERAALCLHRLHLQVRIQRQIIIGAAIGIGAFRHLDIAVRSGDGGMLLRFVINFTQCVVQNFNRIGYVPGSVGVRCICEISIADLVVHIVNLALQLFISFFTFCYFVYKVRTELAEPFSKRLIRFFTLCRFLF